MSLPTPHYELARITGDGRCEEVRIYPLSEPPWEARLDRRGFLQAGLTAAAVLAALRGGAARAASSDAVDADSISCSDALAHDVPVSALAVSPDGATLASAGRGGDIKLWTLPLGSLATVLKDGYRSGQALGFTGDNRILLALHGRSLQRWQLSEETPEQMKGQLAAVGENFLALSADANAVAVLTPAANVEVRSLSGGEPRHVLKQHRGEPAAVLSGDGATLAVDSGRSATVLGDSAQAKRTVPLGGGAPRRLALDLRGRWLAVGNVRGRVHAWSLAPESPSELSLQEHGQPVETLAFSADGTLLAAGDRKGVIHLWRLPEGSLIKTLRGRPGAVTALAFNPDASLLISGTRAGVIQLWELPAGTLRSCLVDLEVSPSSSDGNRYEMRTESGRILSYTAPCGSPLPPGAICTCNCVPGSVAPPAPPVSSGGGSGGYYCTCNKVCVCIPVG
jgi:WD40 repeat protein